MPDPVIKISKEVEAHNDKFINKIGRLMFAWANTESLFEIIFCILAKVSIETAWIIWFTRKSSSARIDFTLRIAQFELHGDKLLGDIEKAASEFLGHPTSLRNHYAHAFYRQDDKYKILSAECVDTPFGENAKPYIHKKRPFDHIRYNELNLALDKLKEINFNLWRIIAALQKSYKVQHAKLPEWLDES